MSTPVAEPATQRSVGPSLVVGLVVAVAVGLAVGAVTAYGQAWLSDSVGSLANSAGPWSLAAFFVARFIRRPSAAAVAAIVTMACSDLGYAAATSLRGGSSSSTTVVFWLVAATLAGPPIGVAGAWSSGRGLRRVVGFSVMAGVLIGEGAYGWTTIADTTEWRYWAIELLIGVALACVVAVRSRRLRDAAAGVATAAVTAGVVFVVARLA